MQKITRLNDTGIFSGRLLGLFICLCLPGIVIAQGGDWYFSWTMGTGMLFNAGTNRQLQVAIPYVVTDAFGNVTPNTFTSKAIAPYSKPSVTYSPFNWDLGNEHEFFVFRLWGDMNYVGHISFGYGRNYYFDLPWVRKRDRRERSFVLKPSINIGYDNLRPGPPTISAPSAIQIES